MQIEQLWYLLEVAKTRSISLAAEHLFVSQPAISISLKNLENELGAKLLTRTKYGTLLTAQGKLIVDLAKECVTHFEEFEQTAYHLLHYDLPNYEGHLDVEVVPNISCSILSQVMGKFSDKYPKITLSVIERNPNTILSHLMNNTCQLGIVCSSDKTRNEFPQVYTLDLFTTQSYALVARHHPLAQRPFITPKEFVRYPIILHSFYQDDPQLLSRSLEEYTLNIVLRCSNMALIAEQIANTEQVTIITHLLVNTPPFDSKRLMAVPFMDPHPPKIYGAYLSNNPQAELCQRFLDQFNTCY